ncbi:Transketolase 1 [Yersinia ruckeri ATCC 29473]|uniref:Uncharacterized protein n=1 Tax=Yersinia ruckeri TaxID=29486 RepID=A0A0A8VFZ2_YERRU|nr:Transketolase 1 [Yersinia ruckeri ATCC 29473]CEK28687.1 hypothetical protein CSF007_14815 [Yersinia ruckeri]
MAGIRFLHGVHAKGADRVGKLFTRGHVLLQVGFKKRSSLPFSQTRY